MNRTACSPEEIKDLGRLGSAHLTTGFIYLNRQTNALVLSVGFASLNQRTVVAVGQCFLPMSSTEHDVVIIKSCCCCFLVSRFVNAHSCRCQFLCHGRVPVGLGQVTTDVAGSCCHPTNKLETTPPSPNLPNQSLPTQCVPHKKRAR
jgi:hypothetical protein